MEETRMIDLKVVIGKPYLYVHQGECQHIVTFVKIWRNSEEDKQTTDFYPSDIFTPVLRKKKCKICTIFPAQWTVVDDPLIGDSISYLCPKCLDSLHSESTVEYKKYKYSHDD